MSLRVGLVCVVVASALGACTDTESATNLHTSGPPTIEQVRLTEMVKNPGSTTLTESRIFAFGFHPQAVDPDEEHPTTSAQIINVHLRVIMGKLLVGNYLQQIECRDFVGFEADGVTKTKFSNVPLGDTPDDVARCAVTDDVLRETCGGPKGICMCNIPGGCGMIPQGAPVGIKDINQDGAADNMRFMPGAAGIRCTGANGRAIDVPMDLGGISGDNGSYWNPSGFQQVPAMGGFEALGPALVLQPVLVPPGNPSAKSALPSNSTCGLTFSPDVVDKENNAVCAPPMGHPRACATLNLDQCGAAQGDTCTPGDVSAFSFKTQPFTVKQTSPADGTTGQQRTGAGADVSVTMYGVIDVNSLPAITVTENGAPYSQFTISLGTGVSSQDPTSFFIHWTNPAGLAANATYVVTIPSQFQDYYRQPIPAPTSFSFTTGP